MRSTFFLCLWLCLLAPPCVAWAQGAPRASEPSGPLTLGAALELALAANPDLAAAGRELETMNATTGEIAEVLEQIPGAADVKVEQITGLPMLTIHIDREKAARLGVMLVLPVLYRLTHRGEDEEERGAVGLAPGLAPP